MEEPPDLIPVGSDAELAGHVGAGDPRPVRLAGGDLLVSLGGPAIGTTRQRFPVDVLRVQADDRRLLAVAHVVARGRSWWRGPITAAFNVDHLAHWDAAPRAHPGDGRLDVVEVDEAMSRRARWQAWRRLPTGTHVPHPQIRARQTSSVSWTFDQARRLYVDGERRGTVRHLAVSVEPDGAIVYT